MTTYGEQIRRSIVRRRRLRMAAKLLLPLAFVGTCIDKGYNDRYWPGTIIRWTQGQETMGGDPEIDLVDAAAQGRTKGEAVAE